MKILPVYHFQVTPGPALAAVILDMAERYDCAPDITALDGCTFVSLTPRQAPVGPSIVQRAASFGWTSVKQRPGLPGPVIVQGRKGSGGPRRRPVQWAMAITFAAEPDAEALTGILADDLPRRDIRSTSTGKWVVYAWRDRGWTKDELAGLWPAVTAIGGRWYRAGDDPVGGPTVTRHFQEPKGV